uniref:SGNH hydrolase-type esterase domain-containing protein n=1 Tax=Cyanothece sp. (strain PCC 7425 / ATCC 29141) TaxID=395961 RepID=B8HYT6_CYAP4
MPSSFTNLDSTMNPKNPNHVVLLGDSIFDNAQYVPGEPPVIKQLQQQLPEGWKATLLAVDGDVTSDVVQQLQQLPADASHLVISVGGNDALTRSFILNQPVKSVGEAMAYFATVIVDFQTSYRQMLKTALSYKKPTCVCTIYDAVPNLSSIEKTALSLFNDVILREAIAVGIPVIDLRAICTEAEDYSQVSPIEPSERGGQKISSNRSEGAILNW